MTLPSLKCCTKCGTVKPASDFGQRSNGRLQACCRECDSARAMDWYRANRDRARENHRRWSAENPERKRQIRQEWGGQHPDYARERTVAAFGLTLEQYHSMLDAQGGVCAICGGTERTGKSLAVDHDRACCPGSKSCGRCVRGLLCAACNVALGAMKDRPAVLRKAAEYLEGSSHR